LIKANPSMLVGTTAAGDCIEKEAPVTGMEINNVGESRVKTN
jgi:hypothetical protein